MSLLQDIVGKVFARRPAPPPPALTVDQRRHWDDHGFLVLPGFFAADAIAALNAEVRRQWDDSRTAPSKLVVDLIGTTGARVHLHDAPAAARQQRHKLNDLYLESDLVRGIILEPRLVAIVTELLGGAPVVCNTLNLEFGSAQPFHTDSLYMTPPKDLNLAASWIALEDCQADAGPLRYYPGSHRIPPYRFSTGRITAVDAEMKAYHAYMEGEVRARGLVEQRFCARSGDVFLWHAQLYHGGAPITNPRRSRRSLVTHYFRADDVPADKVEQVPGGFWLKRAHQPVH
jgi:phytanoyl-CoA hydroxylase